MMSKHTPGPWTMERMEGWLIEGCIHVPNHYEQYDADAKLIAAAPDLLAALERVLEDCAAARIEPFSIGKARAAIAKARGEDTP